MDDEFMAPVIREGFVAPRTKEAGIFECMADPALQKETDFKQFTTTNNTFNSITLKNHLNSSSTTPTSKPPVISEPYGKIVGKGTKKNKADKLRDICGARVQSTDVLKKVEDIIK